MHERAERLGGKLEVWSEPGAGTEVDLRVPPRLLTNHLLLETMSGYFGKEEERS